jgi:hypothetical protein
MLLVRPFENLSGDATQNFLEEGLTEEIITQTASAAPERLGVYARTTALRFEDGDLDFDYVLEGSFRRQGDRLRITARLVDAAEGLALDETTIGRLRTCSRSSQGRRAVARRFSLKPSQTQKNTTVRRRRRRRTKRIWKAGTISRR